MNVTLFFLGWWSTSHIAVFSLAIALALLLVFPSLAADTSVGNLTGITLRPSSTLAVLPFTLSASPIGTTVTIYGTGFSAPLRLQYCEVQHRDRAHNGDDRYDRHGAEWSPDRSGERHATGRRLG